MKFRKAGFSISERMRAVCTICADTVKDGFSAAPCILHLIQFFVASKYIIGPLFFANGICFVLKLFVIRWSYIPQFMVTK